jgi:hypothetical protein
MRAMHHAGGVGEEGAGLQLLPGLDQVALST